eukprot:jgi/Picsp_1/4488/NSC_06709-R1_zinc-finger domain of monoamine-oxidase a repressor r1 protein
MGIAKSSQKSNKKGNKGKDVVTAGQGNGVIKKKKRSAEPGVRQQGGRIYDSKHGTTCHQCRQKTIEVKAHCTSKRCNLYFCPRCLLNRYNEIVEVVRKKKVWDCPKCRGICNCSFCRRKQGLCATGILANIAKSAGFDSVCTLLKTNPNLQDARAVRSLVGRKKENNVKMDSREPKSLRMRCFDDAGVPDCQLPKRKSCLPESKSCPLPTKVPCQDVQIKLICILEFFSTFAAEPLGMASTNLHEVMDHIVQPKWSGSGPKRSILSDILSKIHKIIIHWFGNDDSCTQSSWEIWIMEKYKDKLCECTNVAGRRSSRTLGNYWTASYYDRIHVTYHMIHDAIECGEFSQVIESGLEKSSSLEKIRKEETRKVIELARQEQETHTKKYIKEIICSSRIGELTPEKQKRLLCKARESSKTKLDEGIKSKLRWLRNSEYLRVHPSVRQMPLGRDRDGVEYYFLGSASAVMNDQNGIIGVGPGILKYHVDAVRLEAAMDIKGENEGALKIALLNVSKSK